MSHSIDLKFNQFYYTNFIESIKNNNINNIQFAIINDKCLNYYISNQNITNELTPLHIACSYGHYEIVKLLLEYNVKVIPVCSSSVYYKLHFLLYFSI